MAGKIAKTDTRHYAFKKAVVKKVEPPKAPEPPLAPEIPKRKENK